MSESPVVIIGAGPAGLATAGVLSQKGIPYLLLEKSEQVVDAWHKHYDRLSLHTVKRWSHLPGLPFPDNYQTYVSRRKFIEYCNSYVEHFNIQPQYNKEVVQVVKNDGDWIVQCEDGDAYITKHIVFATGVNRIPVVPSWQGMEKFKGSITHSIDYRNPDPYLRKKVLVVGMGNTGAEIALDLAEKKVQTWISIRGPVSVVPKDIFGRPTQDSARLLDKLPFGIGDRLGSFIGKKFIGDLEPYGIETPKDYPSNILKKHGKTPVIDQGTTYYIKNGKIGIVKEIEYFLPDAIKFKNGLVKSIDDVILATGYRCGIENVLKDHEGLFNEHGIPTALEGSGKFSGLFFTGFNIYGLGGILGTVGDEAKVIAKKVV